MLPCPACRGPAARRSDARSVYERPEAPQFRECEWAQRPGGSSGHSEHIVLGLTPYPSKPASATVSSSIPTLNRSSSSSTHTTISIRTPSSPAAPRRKRPHTPFQIHPISSPPSSTLPDTSNLFSGGVICGSPPAGLLAFSAMSSDGEDGNGHPSSPPPPPPPSARQAATRDPSVLGEKECGDGDGGEARPALEYNEISRSSGHSSPAQLVAGRETVLAGRGGGTRELLVGARRLGKAAVGVETVKVEL